MSTKPETISYFHSVRHEISREFLSAGRAVFTLEVPQRFLDENPDCKPHYTFRLEVPSKDAPIFASLLSGPNNQSDYVYLGIVCADDGHIRLTQKSQLTISSWPVKLLNRVLIRLFAGEQEAIEAAGFSVHHCGRCGRCGRELTHPDSIRTGFGPECQRLMDGGK